MLPMHRRLPLSTLTLLATLLSASLLTGCEAAEDAIDGAAGGGATFTALYDDYLNKCSACHAPGARDGFSNIDTTLDFSTRDTAYSTITNGSASGLSGSAGACNGVTYVGTSSANSLLLAVIDEDVRQAFDVSSNPGCDGDAIKDMTTTHVGEAPPAGFEADLKAWLDAGVPDN
jgi:mono/diheme cytochrome c family protein